MPVTVKPASHKATTYNPSGKYSTPEELLKGACHKEYADCKEFLQSSFQTYDFNNTISPQSNGFVNAAINAYNQHHHLVIRPDDVWFAILVQLSLYINKHAEELRGKFVAHEGKKELEITRGGCRYTTDFGEMADSMGYLLEQNIVDKELRDWIMPDFSTSTKEDETVASIIMMGAMQKYFDYKFNLCCGLPSVTLLGKQSDWVNILDRVEKLNEWGEEPTLWCSLLRPVLARFVVSFTQPASREIRDFWNKIAHHHSQGSGPRYYSGWITAFCFWNDDGELLYGPQAVSQKAQIPGSLMTEPEPKPQRSIISRMLCIPAKPRTSTTSTAPSPSTGPSPSTAPSSSEAPSPSAVPSKPKAPSRKIDLSGPGLTLDGFEFHKIDANDVAPGYSAVPVKVNDNGYEFMSMMIAGSVAAKWSSSGVAAAGGNIGLDTVQPQVGRFMYEQIPEGERVKDPWLSR